jgi:ribosome-interacting GTPase 1
MFALAERLGKTVAEVCDMTVSEFNGWMAYARVKGR